MTQTNVPFHDLKIGQGVEGQLLKARGVRMASKFPDKQGDGKSLRTVLEGTWDGVGHAAIAVSARLFVMSVSSLVMRSVLRTRRRRDIPWPVRVVRGSCLRATL